MPIGAAAARHGAAPARVAAAARRHGILTALLVAGAALRAGVSVAYRPALVYYDSQYYLENARKLVPDTVRPLGYSAFLRVVVTGSGLAAVPVVQHAMGLLMAGLLYALLLRCGVPSWIAALGVAPAVLDGYQLEIEQFVLSETLFELLLAGACAALLWRPRPGLAPAAGAGTLIALAALTRSVAAAAVVPALVTLLIRGPRRPWPAVALLLGFLAPLAGYAIWYHSLHGGYGLTGAEGRFLYARVAPIADCSRLSLPDPERALCPPEPLGRRLTPGHYMWSRASPLYGLRPARQNALGRGFALHVIRDQPLAYLKAVAADTARAFEPTGVLRGNDGPERWRLSATYPLYDGQTLSALRHEGYRHGTVNRRLARLLAGYQRVVYVSGPLLAACLAAALLAIAGVGRARRSGLRGATLLFAALGVVLLLGATAINDFTWRYRLPLIVFLPVAAALAVAALARPARGA